MRITFIKDHQSAYSGNEFYPAGAKSDQRRGDDLISMGVAVAGWGPLAKGIIQRDGESVEAPVIPLTWAQGASGAQPQPFTHPALQDVVISNPPFTEDLRPAYDWTQIRGVHTEISGALNYLGLTSPAKLLARVAEGGKLTDIPGIGKKRAADIVAWCEERL